MTLAVENFTALAGRGNSPELLSLCTCGELSVAVDLQVDQARFDAGRPDEQTDGGHDDAALERRAPGVGGLALSGVEGRLGHVVRPFRVPDSAAGDDGFRRRRRGRHALNHRGILGFRRHHSQALRRQTLDAAR